MGKRQTGIILTNDNCIACNKCIMTCPIPGASRSVSDRGKNTKIVVEDSKCIRCGECLKSCMHNAREYIDDTEQFLDDLEKKDIVMLFAPSFFLIYKEKAGRIINYLLSAGAKGAYDVSMGADIATWGYLKYIDEHPEGGVVLQSCPVIVNYAEKYSYELFSRLVPIHSPAVCTAIYVHKYLKRPEKLAFIGPCIAKKDEFESPETNGEISYNVTFGHLMDALKNVDFSGYPNDLTLRSKGLGTLYPLQGGIKANLRNYLEQNELVFSLDGMARHFSNMEHYEKTIFREGITPLVTDMVSCEFGCFMSSGTEKDSIEFIEMADFQQRLDCTAVAVAPELYSRQISGAEKKKELYERFKNFDIEDFKRTYRSQFIYKRTIPESVLDEIYDSMYKLTEADRHIDCNSCGYNSCREMAEAVAFGYNRIENCVHYERAENKRLYLTDIVTGIPSVTTFSNRLNEIINGHMAEKYSAVGFSLLDWELVNSRFNYTEGDRGLAEFAASAFALAGSNELVTRIGGVDFMAVIEKENVESFIKGIAAIIIHPYNGLHEVEYPVTVAIGIYNIQTKDSVAGDIISHANIAVDAAKRENGHVFYYSESMKTKLLESMELVKSFPEAIRRHEFVVYYQPKVDIRTNRLYGAEALIRWKTDEGMISPGKFIPLFEKNGLVCQLDFYVLRAVCHDLRKWIDDGNDPVCVSSNFSKLHFENTDVVDRIIEIVDEFAIPHKYIEIEITETTYEGRKEILTQVLNRLKESGFSTSIDDFGSGYSSLNILSELDFQVLKLDKAFLDSGIDNMKVRNIVESVITMAKKLQMRVVAEGVEHREELDFLKELSCDLIQGYYFDRPMPVKEFEKRLTTPDYYS